jgi:hypothetical protein
MRLKGGVLVWTIGGIEDRVEVKLLEVRMANGRTPVTFQGLNNGYFIWGRSC